MSKLVLGVGLAAKLEQALNRNGITDLADIDWLCERGNISKVHLLRLGRVRLTLPEHLIDCDAAPFNPWVNEGWTVKEHQKSGAWKWDPWQVHLCIDKLRKKPSRKLDLNANVLDYLLAKPHLIPEGWKRNEYGMRRYIFFYGTIYCCSIDGVPYVRCLYWDDGLWHWNHNRLDDGPTNDTPRAMRAI